MKITYLGASEDYEYRLAQICTGKRSDVATLEKTIAILEEMGWKNWDWFGDAEDEFAQIEVGDKDEYNDLVADYKEAKRRAHKLILINPA